jgi:hypothetical protein
MENTGSSPKQERDGRADRMAIKDDRHAMPGLHSLDFGGKCRMIGRVVLRPACGNLVERWLLPFAPDVQPIKVRRRTQGGRVGARIKRSSCRVTVGVNDIAVKRRLDYRNVSQKPLIKLSNMPIRV